MRFRHQLAACVSVALSFCGAQRIQGEPAPRALRIGASFASVHGDVGRWHATFTKALGERGAAGVALSAENDADLQIDQCDYLLRQSKVQTTTTPSRASWLARMPQAFLCLP